MSGERWPGRPVARWQRVIVAYVLIMLTALAVGVAITAKVQGDNADASLHEAQVDACTRGNVLRHSLRHAFNTVTHESVSELRRAQQQSNDIPHKFFPAIPPKRFAQLQRQQQHRTQRAVARLKTTNHRVNVALRTVDCEAVFPAP